MKQGIAGLTVLIGVTASSALAIDGAYLGAQGGYSSIKASQEGTLGGGGFSGTDYLTGAAYGVYGGYGQTLNNTPIYLGAELEASGNTGGSDQSYNSVSTELKQTYNYGASARLGYNYNDCFMPYVRVGVNRARFEQVGGGIDNEDTKTGLAAGIGAEYRINPSWGVRAEALSTHYGRMDSSAPGSSISSKLTDRQARVGLSYYF